MTTANANTKRFYLYTTLALLIVAALSLDTHASESESTSTSKVRPAYVVLVVDTAKPCTDPPNVFSLFPSKAAADKWVKRTITDRVRYRVTVVETVKVNAPSR